MRAQTARIPLLIALLGGCAIVGACDASSSGAASNSSQTEETPPTPEKVVKSNEEWKEILTPEQFRITREGGTERAFTGEYTDTTTPGIYACVCCDTPLFASETKFHSGCGWPSFFNFMPGSVTEHTDTAFGMVRVEVRCARCDAHLGHVFDDGPESVGGLRYCINSASLKLDEQPRPEAPDVGH